MKKLIDPETLKNKIRDDMDIDGANYARVKMHIDEAEYDAMDFCGELCIFAERLIEKAKPKWIPVTERLPELHKRVICCGPKGGTFVAEARECSGRILWDDRQRIGKRNVTHWMPLPEPPKGVE